MMLNAPINEDSEFFRLRFNNYLENNPLNDANIHETATALHSIAQSYLMEGNVPEAETYLQRAIDLYRKTSDEHSLMMCLSQYAPILRHFSKREEAEESLIEVVKIIKKLDIKKDIKEKDIKTWLFKSYFHNLLEIYKEPAEALALRKKLKQEYVSSSDSI